MVNRDKEETDSKTFSLFSQIIRSLSRNLQEFELEGEKLAQRPHIICLTETWQKITLTMTSSKIKDTNLSLVALELNEEEVFASMFTSGHYIG